MSQATVAVSPTRPIQPEGLAPLFKLGILVLALFILAGFYELWIARSEFANRAYQTVITNPRVRSELGAKVHIPVVVGWNLNDIAFLFGLIEGKEGWGYITVQMSKARGQWIFPELRVHNVTEKHIINLSTAPPAVSPDQLHAKARLYLVALGSGAQPEVDGVASFLQKEFGIQAKVLPSFQPPDEAFDKRRQQWIAEMLVQAMAHQFPEVASDLEGKVVGVIDGDIYLRAPKWKFAFNYREGDKFAVLPTQRLDPGFYGLKPSISIRNERLLKLAAKNVGLLYFGFKMNSDPNSVMVFGQDPRDMDVASGKFLITDLNSQANSANTNGTPCLSFSTANLNGMPRLEPIHACTSFYDNSEGTIYQVELSRGEFRLERNDLFRTGPMPLFIHRMQFSHMYDSKRRAFGKSSWQNLDDTVRSTDPQSIQTIEISGVTFQRLTPGNGFSTDAKYIAPENAGEFSGAVLSWDQGKWKIQTRDEIWHYLGCGPDTAVPCLFMDRASLAGDSIQVVRDKDGDIDKVIQKSASDLPGASAHDHIWTATYDGRMIRTIEDTDGSAVRYEYDDDGYLTDVLSEGHKLRYEYDTAHRMNRTIEDGRELRLHYDSEGRVEELDLPDHVIYRIHYSGEAIEIDTPGEHYTLKMRYGFFETAKEARN